MAQYDWSRFTASINIQAPIEAVFEAWQTKQGMEGWFLRLCEYRGEAGNLLKNDEHVTAGCKYRWRWHGWADDVEENGKILKVEAPLEFEFTFNSNGATDMKVLVQLSSEDNETIVQLEQYNIPTDDKAKAEWHVGCFNGWTFYLSNLKSYLEGGVDLRNKDPRKMKHKVVNS